MNSFGKLASVAFIAVVTLFLGATANPASANLEVSDVDYSGKLGNVRTDIARTGNRLQIQVSMKLDCTRKTIRSAHVITTKVNPKSGKFRFITPKDQRKVYVGAWFADIVGKITKSGEVKGRVGMVKSDHFSGNYTCFSGKSVKNFWEPFAAKSVDPDRLSIYKFRSGDLRVRFAVNGKHVYVESLRDHRTCTGGPKNWPDGWGLYASTVPLKVKGDSFGLDLSESDSEDSSRWKLTGKIRNGKITGTFLFAGQSDSDNPNGPLKCSTGKSYDNPKIKFTAKVVK